MLAIDTLSPEQQLEYYKSQYAKQLKLVSRMVWFAWEFKFQRDARLVELAQIKTGNVDAYPYEMTDDERTLNTIFTRFIIDEKL
jgi:hypothetical protein